MDKLQTIEVPKNIFSTKEQRGQCVITVRRCEIFRGEWTDEIGAKVRMYARLHQCVIETRSLTSNRLWSRVSYKEKDDE